MLSQLKSVESSVVLDPTDFDADDANFNKYETNQNSAVKQQGNCVITQLHSV